MITLQNDYFEITLPNALITSSSTSPAWNAYCAAQNNLNTPALFSNIMMKVFSVPGSSGTKSVVERHHLFPKAYLERLGYTDIKDTNQVANYAYIEWSDNLGISDTEPKVYWPKMIEGKTNDQVQTMMRENALPDEWTQLDYQEFLLERRKKMASIIRDAFASL